MNIVVLGGGVSSERLISLDTSAAILRALRARGHKAVFIDLFLGLENANESFETLFESQDGLAENIEKSRNISDQELNLICERRNGCVIGPNVLAICKFADFVFIGMHGEYGEDGRIQSVLDLMGVKYNGSGPLGSAIAMDKGISRAIMQSIGIRVPPLVRHAPCIVKQVNGGSSIGMKLCNTDEELEAILLDSKTDLDNILIEQRIYGRDVSVAVLDGKALAPIDLIPPKGHILDFTAKYSDGENGKKMVCPAQLNEKVTKEICEAAEKLHKAMKLSVYSRTDFIIDSQGIPWCLEVNNLPGMTEHSALPLEAAHEGINFISLCDMIVKLSLEK